MYTNNTTIFFRVYFPAAMQTHEYKCTYDSKIWGKTDQDQDFKLNLDTFFV